MTRTRNGSESAWKPEMTKADGKDEVFGIKFYCIDFIKVAFDHNLQRSSLQNNLPV
jgi:hypothetical protein